MPSTWPASSGNPLSPRPVAEWLPLLSFRAEAFLEFNRAMDAALLDLERRYPQRTLRQRWKGPRRRPK